MVEKMKEMMRVCWNEHLPNLRSLSLKELKKVRLINASFNHLTSLEIEELDRLECMPEWLFLNNQNLSYVTISSLFLNKQNLSYVTISSCPMLIGLPNGLDTLNSLKSLCIMYCENMKSIGNPSGGARQSQGILCWPRITECGELMELPCQMLESWAPTIVVLQLVGLRRLKNLPMLIDCLAGTCTRLAGLRIKGVPKFMS